jgi:hypothetical protein
MASHIRVSLHVYSTNIQIYSAGTFGSYIERYRGYNPSAATYQGVRDVLLCVGDWTLTLHKWSSVLKFRI